MKRIIEISEEILILYDILKNNEYMNKYKKAKILKKIEELIYKENYLFSLLVIDKEHYDDYLEEINNCKNNLIILRLRHYLIYLYSKNKIFHPELIYPEYNNSKYNKFKFFEIEKEIEKIIMKNTTNKKSNYDQLFMDKFLELEFFQNKFKLKFNNLEENLSEKEIKLFRQSKKNHIIKQITDMINYGNIKASIIIIKSLFEFGYDDYEYIYNEVINSVNDKEKLDKFLIFFGNRNKIK